VRKYGREAGDLEGTGLDPRRNDYAAQTLTTAPVDGPTLDLRGRRMPVAGTLVMGVVNASPESFSDPGQFLGFDRQIEHCAALINAGADILDIGGQSAITNRPELAATEELDRVLPLVEWIRGQFPDVVISVDTYKPEVVRGVLKAGAHIINDVSGLMYPEIVDLCVEHAAALVIMHTRARPKQRLQRRDLYDDVTSDVVDFLGQRMEVASERGLKRESMILDPGPDFTKTPHQTIAVLRAIGQVRSFGRPVLLALSRKDFLGAITGRSPRGRDAATHAALAYFASRPGNIVRVHDVEAACDVIQTVEVLAGLREIDPDYLLPDQIRHEAAPRD